MATVTASLDKEKRARLTVYGNLTIQNAGALVDAFDKLFHQDVTQFQVDLGKVAYLDSTGLSCLVRIQQRLGQVQGHLEVVGVTPSALEIFRATRLDRVLKLRAAGAPEGPGV